MNLCKQKIEEQINKVIRKVKEHLNTLKEASKRNKLNFYECFCKNIIFTEYEIGKINFEDEKRIYYPILRTPKGFKVISNEIYCKTLQVPKGFKVASLIYSVNDKYYQIINKYVLKSEKLNFNIHITATSYVWLLGYFNYDIQLQMKNAYVVESVVNYKIKINHIKFFVERDFKEELSNKILTESLEGKNVSYNDFANTKSHNHYRALYVDYRSRYCQNFLLNSPKPNWKENLRILLKKYADKSIYENIIAQIEKVSSKIKEEDEYREAYYLNEKQSLISVVYFKKYNDECIFYENEQFVLDIPNPMRWCKVCLYVVNKVYNEELLKVVQEEDVIEEDSYSIRLNDIDLNSKMYVLDILEKFKSKDD